MRKIILSLLTSAMVIPMTSCKDKLVSFDQLPQSAKAFIGEYFAGAKVSLAILDRELCCKTYDVTFADGRSVEFDAKGEWKDVDCKRNALPDGLLPEAIAAYLTNNHPEVFACEINRDRRDWEVKLSNGLDLKFDKMFRLVEIDD